VQLVSTAAARSQALLAAVLFSTGGAAIKAEAFDGLQVSAVRSGIAALALLLWVRLSARPSRGESVAGGVWTMRVVPAGIVYAATLTLFVLSTKLTTAANAIFLQSTAPVYILLLAPALLGERFRARDLTYLAVVASGMILCFAGRPPATATAPNPATGNLLAVMCGVAWALTLIALRHVERDRTRPGVGMAAVVAGNALACLVALPFAWPFPAATAGAWATLVYLGVVQIALAYLFLTNAVRHLPALEISLLLLLEPVLNPVWTWVIQGEDPGTWTMVGGLVIIVATAGKAVFDTRSNGRSPQRAQRRLSHEGHKDD
jgi:drug/metabolite transporter (DMT)-like permease